MDAKERLYLLLVILGEGVVCLYLSTVTYVMSCWMVHDSVAFHMKTADWWLAAGRKFLFFSAVALGAGGTVFLANRPVMRWLGVEGKRIPLTIASVFAGAIILCALVGSIRFAIEKPYM